MIRHVSRILVLMSTGLISSSAVAGVVAWAYCDMCGYSHRNVPSQYARNVTTVCANGVCTIVRHTEVNATNALVEAPRPNPQAPSPHEAIEAAASILRCDASDVVYDLGCGDGRVLVYLRQRYGCRCVGIESDPALVIKARKRVRDAGFTPHQIRIVQGDARDYVLTGATKVYMFLPTTLIAELVPTIPKHVNIVSLWHPLGIRQRQIVKNGFYFYVSTTTP